MVTFEIYLTKEQAGALPSIAAFFKQPNAEAYLLWIAEAGLNSMMDEGNVEVELTWNATALTRLWNGHRPKTPSIDGKVRIQLDLDLLPHQIEALDIMARAGSQTMNELVRQSIVSYTASWLEAAMSERKVSPETWAYCSKMYRIFGGSSPTCLSPNVA